MIQLLWERALGDISLATGHYKDFVCKLILDTLAGVDLKDNYNDKI